MVSAKSETVQPAGCVVVGAGVAGLTAAWYLVRAGVPVTLLEAAHAVGGRYMTHGEVDFRHDGSSFSFPVDRGLHGIWRQYRNLRRLFQECGVHTRLRPAGAQEFIWRGAGGNVHYMEIGDCVRANPLPDLFAGSAMFGNARFRNAVMLSSPLRQHCSMRRFMEVLAFDPCADLVRYDRLSVADFIRGLPRVIQEFLTTLTLSAFFLQPHEVSLAALMLSLRHHAIADKRDSFFEVMDGDSQSAFFGPLVEQFNVHGGQLWLHSQAESIVFEGELVRAVVVQDTRSGGRKTVPVRTLVLALDAPALARLLARSPGPPIISPQTIPKGKHCLAVRLWFKKSPQDGRAPSGVFGNGFSADNFFWIHRLQRVYAPWSEATNGGGVIECHLYGDNATRASMETDGEVQARVTRAVEEGWPELRESVVFGHVQRNPETHPAFAPGVLTRMPAVRTRYENVALCGDWVACPNGVMFLERACLTGLLAARTVAPALGVGLSKLPEPLEPFPAARSVAWAGTTLRGLRALRFFGGYASRQRL